MLSEFVVYFRLGLEHILDVAGVDHILFIVALSATFVWDEWRRVIILITSFTVGHSITLVLATTHAVPVSSDTVEILIPLTILVTSMANIWQRNKFEHRYEKERLANVILYTLTLFFGLIHGLGFSNFLRALLGGEESILLPLLAFNIGLEVGQIFLVAGILATSVIVLRNGVVRRKHWTLTLSVLTTFAAIIMVITRVVGN